MAAFTSRLSKVPQHSQVHSLSFSVSSLFMFPQQEQVFELGSKVPIFKIFLPYHSALYSNMVTKVPQPASLIDCARQWFLSILDTCNVSIAILSWFLISSLETLCKKSLRWLATFSCNIANLCFVRLPLFFEYLRCTYFNFDCALRKYFGLSNSCPLEATMNVLIPKSIPIVVFSLIFFLGLITSPVSQRIETKYLPVGVLLIVACLISPLIGLCKTISIPFLNLGITSLPSSKKTFCGILKLPPFDFFLNVGKLFCPLKNLRYAASKFMSATCKDWLFTSLSHSHSFFKSFNCRCKSYLDKFTCFEAYAICFVSNAMLYRKRTEPICLFKRTFCSSVGEILYLNAFNTMQIYYLFSIIQKNKLTLNAIQPIHAKAMNWISC